MSLRITSVITGRMRSVSLTTASRYSSPSSARMRSTTCGWRASRSNAHASAVAVVSWPAASSVISSSRSSWSSASPSATISDRMSVRSPTSGSARRAAISSKRISSTSSRSASSRFSGGNHSQRMLRGSQKSQRALLREPRQQRAQAVQAARVLDPEDEPQDHLERDRLHARAQRDRHAARPALDVGDGDLVDLVAVVLDQLAVERRADQLALALPLLAVGRRAATAGRACPRRTACAPRPPARCRGRPRTPA